MMGAKLWYDLTSESKLRDSIPALIGAINATLGQTDSTPEPSTIHTTTTTSVGPSADAEKMSIDEASERISKRVVKEESNGVYIEKL